MPEDAGRVWIPVSGIFYRILFADRVAGALDPARHPQGRFHHSGEAAVYLSPSHEAAAVAIDSYYRNDDPPRIILPIRINAARIADLREVSGHRALGLEAHETTVNWREELAAGSRPASWTASDAARRAGAQGMLYRSRKAPEHYHLVVFDWNRPGGAQLTLAGDPSPFR